MSTKEKIKLYNFYVDFENAKGELWFQTFAKSTKEAMKNFNTIKKDTSKAASLEVGSYDISDLEIEIEESDE